MKTTILSGNAVEISDYDLYTIDLDVVRKSEQCF